MKFRILLVAFFTISILSCKTEQKNETKPKLVVGIVVDQMRYDYLTRFYNRYGEGGFKRLMNHGFLATNANFDYVPTYTAVGHTSIYTGTTPQSHGIISNNWYDKYEKKFIYCVDDANYQSVGIKGLAGQKSPYRMQTTTITDELKLAQNQRGKTIGVAIKDRSSILPAGHTADAAYWYQGGDDNKFITSTFYMNSLPQWVNDFNSNKKADGYLSKPWETLYDISTYTSSIADDNRYERPFQGEEKPVFPHDLPKLRKENGNYSIISSTPFGNSLTLDFAIAAIEGESLGKSEFTDFLAVSFSSTDYVGHQFGPDAVEIEDTYLRLDKNLESFLNYLDQNIGKGNYTIFLSADHGAVQVPSYLQSLKIPAHYFNILNYKTHITNELKTRFGSGDFIENVSNFQIFLNKEELKRRRLSVDEVSDFLVEVSINYNGIYKAITAKTLQETEFSSGILHKIQQGYNQKYSGDVILVPLPSTLGGSRQGTSHGSGYSYDTHVPILFYGNGIKQGKSSEPYFIRDIAPTLATLLKVEFPNGTTGKVIAEALK